MSSIRKIVFILLVFVAAALTEEDLATSIAQQYQQEGLSIKLFNQGGISSNENSVCVCDYYKRMPTS